MLYLLVFYIKNDFVKKYSNKRVIAKKEKY